MVAFTADELQWVLEHKFRSGASKGASIVPTQVVKWLANGTFEILAIFFTRIALAPCPPKAWKTLLLRPLYKGKGSMLECNNFRALAIMGPFMKLFMALIDKRLSDLSESMALRAPMQAGFRPKHSLEDLVLVLQTVVQHAVVCKQ